MIRTSLLALALALPGIALACGGESMTAKADDAAKVELAAVHADADATKCAQKAELVGSNCKYSTGMMAQRVHTDGKDTTLTAHLEANDSQLDSHVAAPFKVKDLYVIANEVVDGIEDPAADLALEGKVLEVDGVKYFLVTGFKKATS